LSRLSAPHAVPGSDHKDPANRLFPPPKPKWMRWATYERHIDRYSGYDAVLLKESAAFLAKLSAQIGAK
jgi:hypothetical protein